MRCTDHILREGKDWWWCSVCLRGEKEIESDDMIITLPLEQAPPEKKERKKREPKPVNQRALNVIRAAMIREKFMSLRRLRRLKLNEEKTRLALQKLEENGLVSKIERQSGARFYVRMKSIVPGIEKKEGWIQRSVEKILAKADSPSKPISRNVLFNTIRPLDAETFDFLLSGLIKDGVLRTYRGKKVYYRWEGG